MRLRLLVLYSVIHFALSMIAGVIAFGADFDQLRSRSAASRTAAVVHDVLMAPHSMVIRAIPNRQLTRSARWLVPSLLILHSVAWGALAVVATLTWKRRRLVSSRE
jgi:hypothetical protein